VSNLTKREQIAAMVYPSVWHRWPDGEIDSKGDATEAVAAADALIEALKDSEPEPDPRDARIAELERQLSEAADWFSEYGHMHTVRGKHDKAKVNFERSAKLNAVLKGASDES
jgi:hypothetical protein